MQKRMVTRTFKSPFPLLGEMAKLTAVLQREDDMYVATCPEVGTVSQGRTVEEAIANLKEATEGYLEEFSVPLKPAPILATFEVSGASRT